MDSNAGSANVASLMRYTLSNIQEGSSKLWCAARPDSRACHQLRFAALLPAGLGPAWQSACGASKPAS